MTEQPTNPKATAKAAKAYAKASRKWYQKKRYIALIVLGVFMLIAAATSGGGDSADNTADKDSSSVSDTGDTSTGGDKAEPKAEKKKPAPKATWKTVASLQGNTNKSGPDFHLNGCDTRLKYTVNGDMSIVAFYVMESGKKLMEDGGIPVASPTESGPGETVLREDEGDYYVEVVAANADWTATVQEKC